MLTTAHTLTTDEFFNQVHAMDPKVAVFDCDGTLWSGDAGSSFMWWSMSSGLLSSARADWLRNRYDGYRSATVSELEICGDMVAVYAGLPETTLREAAATFFREHIEPNIFPELQRLIAELQSCGVAIWAVSSTNNWVIEEGVRRFSIAADHVLAARVSITDGIITDNVLVVPTDEGKVAALGTKGITQPDVVFGNSIHDAAMLAIARRAFPVNPSDGLQQRSAEEGWAMYHPSEAASTPSDTHDEAI